VRRYERRRSGELIHIDIKKLGNSTIEPARATVAASDGSSFTSSSTDASRVAFTQIEPDERKRSAVVSALRSVSILADFDAHQAQDAAAVAGKDLLWPQCFDALQN
jgi:hypothetical protein